MRRATDAGSSSAPPRRRHGLRVHVQGAGKVGRVLVSRLRRSGCPVTSRAARNGLPRKIVADVIVFAVRDGQVSREAERWRDASAIPPEAVVLHVAGSLEPGVLDILRPICRGVGQFHPLVSFASSRKPPSLTGAYALVSGDRAAQRAAKQLADALGMRTRRGDGVDRTAYHAAAWLVAGGTVALAAAARDMLVAEGIAPRDAERMIEPLLRSIAENVGALGLPEALTGVVRRGDEATLRRHAEALANHCPDHLDLYLAAARAQVPMARELGDASDDALDGVAQSIDRLGFGRRPRSD